MCEVGIYIARNNSPNPGGLVHVEPVHRVVGGSRGICDERYCGERIFGLIAKCLRQDFNLS